MVFHIVSQCSHIRIGTFLIGCSKIGSLRICIFPIQLSSDRRSSDRLSNSHDSATRDSDWYTYEETKLFLYCKASFHLQLQVLKQSIYMHIHRAGPSMHIQEGRPIITDLQGTPAVNLPHATCHMPHPPKCIQNLIETWVSAQCALIETNFFGNIVLVHQEGHNIYIQKE